MSRTLVIDLCERPRFSLFVNHSMVMCSDFKEYSLGSTILELIRTFDIDSVKCLVKPVSVDSKKNFPLMQINSGYVNVNTEDIRYISNICKDNGVHKVSFVSYMSYYKMMCKGSTIVLDYTFGDILIAVVMEASVIRAVHIDSAMHIEAMLKKEYEVGGGGKYNVVNARSFKLMELYDDLLSNYDNSIDKYVGAVSPALFCYVERNTLDLTRLENPTTFVTAQEILAVNLKGSSPPKGVSGVKSYTTSIRNGKGKAPTKSTLNKKKKKQSKVRYGKGRVTTGEAEVKEIPSKGSGVVMLCNIILGVLLGVSLVLSSQLPADLVGIKENVYLLQKQSSAYTSYYDTLDRVYKTKELDSPKLLYIYEGIQSSPLDGIIGRIDIAGDNVELEVYVNDSGTLGAFTASLGAVMNILNTQDQGSISIGNSTMLKVVITGQVNY